MRTSAILCGLLTLLALGLGAPVVEAQPCGGTTFWKNDSLPDVPVGPISVAIIQGLCEGEAAAQSFQMPAGMAAQRLRQVSVGFGHIAGGAGFQATANVEIYEGPVTFGAGGAAVLPPKIFDLNDDAGQSAQLASTAINTIDLLPYNITVSDDFVVAIRMNFNLSFPGCPPGGAQANFFTDAGGCSPGTSLLDVAGTGWVDPTAWSILCPLFYTGQWAIRACTDDVASPWTDLGGGTAGSNGVPLLQGFGPLTGGSLMTLDLSNGPSSGITLLWIADASAPFNALGGTVHAFPFVDQLVLPTDPSGSIVGSATWPPGVPPGVMLWFQFLCADGANPFGISLSNGLKATTP